MRKNKLYNRRDINIFAKGGGWSDQGWFTPEYKMTSGGGVAIDSEGNPIYEGSHLSTAGGLALGATVAGGITGGLAGENETGVGNALKGIGQVASVLPGPYGAAISMGLQAAGSLTNAAFGSNIDEAKVAEIKNRAINQATQEFSHSSNEDLLAQNQSMTMLGDVSRRDIGSDGWFANKAKKKARELSYLNQEANKSMINNFGNAVDTVAQNNFFRSIDTGNNILAFGGNIFDDGGKYIPSDYIVNFIKDKEGFRGKTYKDGKGIDTIGYGFTDPNLLKKYVGKEMSKKDAEAQLRKELNSRIKVLENTVPNWGILPQDSRDALLSYHYNFPISEKSSPKLFKALREQNWYEAAKQIDAGINDKDNPGLRIRRQEEQKLFKRGFIPERKNQNESITQYPDVLRTNISPVISPVYVGPKKIQMPVFDSFQEGEEPAVSTNVLNLPTLDQVYRGLYPQGSLGDYLYNKDNSGGMITPAQFLDMIHSKKFGGELQTQGAEFPGMMTYIENGGTHEENPLGGIPVGVDPQGTPNLVEEGETIFNDYVFSNRLEVPKEVKKVLGLRGKKKYTFAEASKHLNKEAEERPNDQISENGLEDSLSKLMGIQEIVKQNNEQNIMAEGGNIHIAENKKGTFTAAATKHHMGVQEFANKVLANKDNYSPAMVKKANFVRNASKWHALGGNLYPNGSWMNTLRSYNYGNNDLNWNFNNWMNPWSNPIWEYTKPGNTDNHYVPIDISRDQVIKAENQKDYQDFIKAMNLDATEGDPNEAAKAYMNFYDSKVTNPGNKFYTDGTLRSDWRDYAKRIMTDHIAGIGHSMAAREGKRYFYTDPTTGNKVFVAAPENLNNYIIGEGVLNTEDPRWTDYEIKGLANGVTPQVAPSPDDTGVQTEETIVNNNQEPLRDYPEYLRYAPTVLSGLGVLTDTLGLTNRPDYTLSRGLSNLAGNTRYRPISYTPVGEYLTYKPVDTVKQAIDQRAAHQAIARNLMNISGGNRGTLAAGLLANNYQDVVNSGNAIFNANLSNRKTEEGVGTFNRGTDTTNAQGSLSAQQANQNAYMSAQQQRNALYAAALEAREKERALSFANRNANLLQFTNNLGEIGRENWAQNRLNWLIRNGYYRRYNDAISTPTKKKSKESKTSEVKEPVYYTNFAEWASNRMNGGKLNRKKNK